MSVQEKMFQEVMSAIQDGNRPRARDLLTRLLKSNTENALYWLWMSAVVDSRRERVHCLKEVLRIDPENQDARRGLILMGAMPLDEKLVIPQDLLKRNWQKQIQLGPSVESLSVQQFWRQMILYGVIAVVVVGLILAGIFGFQNTRPKAVVQRSPLATYGPTPTPLASTLLAELSTSSADANATPQLMALLVTYTPTPIYVNTPHPRSEAYRTALRSYQKQDWSSMLEYIDQAIKIEPEAPDLFYYQGEAYRGLENYPLALKSYNQAIQIAPAFAPGYLGRGKAIFESSPTRVREVQKDFEKAAELDVDLLEARYQLAELAINQGDGDMALTWLEPLVQNAVDTPTLHFLLGQAYQLQGDNTKALQEITKSITMDQTLLPAYRLAGKVYLDLNQPDQAAESLLMYVQYEEDAQALAWLGAAYVQKDEYDLAITVFDRALKLDDRQAEIYQQRGSLFLQIDEIEKAESDLRQALRLNPKLFDTYIYLGQVYLLQGKNGNAYMNLSTAEAYASTDQDWAQIYYWRAKSLEALGEIKVAYRDWQKLIALPAGIVSEDRLEEANKRVAELSTPTMTPITPTLTMTRQPTRTVTITRTLQPTWTQIPTKTPIPSKTSLPLSTP